MDKINILTILLLSSFCFSADADERLYKIELVIFSQDMPNTEVFDQTESKIAWPKNVVNSTAYKQVDPQYLNLQGSYTKMAGSQNYRPLMHVAWIQAVKQNRLSHAVQINNAEGTIDGFFRIQRGNLVHMIADIEYSPDHYAGSVIYRLKEKRRFKLNEMHYLDHPKFGVLARISPIKESD